MQTPQPALDAVTIEERLNEMLDAVLSSRRTASEPAKQLAKCSRAQQDFALHWLGVIISTNSEMGFQFACHAPQAFSVMGLAQVEQWVLHGMDIYDRQGLYPGSQALADINGFALTFSQSRTAVGLDRDAGAILVHFLRGLSGRGLRVKTGETNCTDTEVVYLPGTINDYPSREKNLSLYRLIATQLWAQTRFGTFRRASPNAPRLSEQLSRYSDPKKAQQLFERLEQARLDACIRRTLPGLGRQMDLLLNRSPKNNLKWQALIAPLCCTDATVTQTLAVLEQAYRDNQDLALAPPWAGRIDIALAEQAMDIRTQREREQLQTQLAQWLKDQPLEGNTAQELKITSDDDPKDALGPVSFSIEINGESTSAPPAVNQLVQSLLLDFDQLPTKALAPTSATNYDAREQPSLSPQAEEPNQYPQNPCYHYDEWDFRRRHYRKNWCVLRELQMPMGEGSFYPQTIEKYKGSVIELRRTFEALRTSVRRVRRVRSGDEIDLDALVDARVSAFCGEEMSDRVLSRLDRSERDIAVIFMVDVSGSTKGWINDAERECLVLLCEALQVLGDRYAIYGFSGMTRKRCELYRIKEMDEAYSDAVKARIAGIEPKDYTRMGATIRHLTMLLNKVSSRTRLLITLSDGKPDDYDGYRGEYGIEDTRQALIEAKRSGIHPFCITIDREARDYLPHMYGAVNYTQVDNVHRLPIRVSDIYRRLTV